jgi:hypothetical protein
MRSMATWLVTGLRAHSATATWRLFGTFSCFLVGKTPSFIESFCVDQKFQRSGNLVGDFGLIPVTTNGRPIGFQRPVVARVTTRPEDDRARQNTAVAVTHTNPIDWKGLANYRAILTTLPLKMFSENLLATDIPVVHSAKGLDHLKSGDVVTLFRVPA